MAIYCSAEGDYLRSASGTSNNPTSGTWAISFWMKASANDGAIISKYEGGGTGWMVVLSANTNLYFWVGTTYSSEIIVPSGGSSNNAWNHILLVRYSGTHYAYLNGAVQTISGSDNRDISQPNSISSLGEALQRPSAPWSQYVGSMFDCRLYDNPAWAAEHAAVAKILYESRGKDCVVDGLKWRVGLMDAGDLSNCASSVDVSGSGVNLSSVTGTPQWTAEAFKGF